MKKLRLAGAVVVTLLVVFAARYFGPNRSYRVETAVDGVRLSHEAPRSHTGEGPAVLRLEVKGEGTTPVRVVLATRIQGTETWTTRPPAREEAAPGGGKGKVLVFEVPHQPPTTRVYYRFEARAGDGPPVMLERRPGEPMMVKFKDPVPAWVVAPHVLCMFGGFFFLVWSAFLLVFRSPDDPPGAAVRPARLAWLIMFLGGVPFGIAMNWYAFHVYWEAFPFGKDVTDNKTQVALVVWGAAALFLAKTKGEGKASRAFAVAMALIVLAVYLIPHSAQVG